MKKILFVASEGVPFIKTGGLADVVGSLPKELDKEYYDVRVIMPKYSCMKQEMKDKMEYVTHFYMDFHWKSEYVGVLKAEVEGIPDEEDVRAFRAGIVLGDGTRCLPAQLEITGGSVCFVTVMEGKYHQVKRMLAARGKPVRALRRLSVGALTIPESLAAGEVSELGEADLCKVLREYPIGK